MFSNNFHQKCEEYDEKVEEVGYGHDDGARDDGEAGLELVELRCRAGATRYGIAGVRSGISGGGISGNFTKRRK